MNDTKPQRRPPPTTTEEASTQKPRTDSPSPRIDGRSLRRTGRTVQFATRVSADFDQRFREIAKRDSLLFARLLELSLEAYENKK